MDLAWLEFAWKVGITLVNVIGWGWMYLTNRDRVTNTRIGKLETDIDAKLDDHANRLTSLETEARMAPTHNDLSALHARINEVTSTLKRIEGEGAAQTRILNLVYESLIDRRKP